METPVRTGPLQGPLSSILAAPVGQTGPSPRTVRPHPWPGLTGLAFYTGKWPLQWPGFSGLTRGLSSAGPAQGMHFGY